MICAFDNESGYWLAAGKGYLRPIVVEAGTRKEAMDEYMRQCENQQADEYAMEQQMTALSLQNDPEGEYK